MVENRKILREVTTVSRLYHRYIVRYYQAWLEGGQSAGSSSEGSEDDDEDDEDEDCSSQFTTSEDEEDSDWMLATSSGADTLLF